MAFVIKFAKTVRNNWKKSILFTGIAIYGVKWATEKYEDDLLRRQYCAEARVYGNVKSKLGERPRRITVFLNPAASGGGARKLFEKNAAPLLYLAGLDVNVVRTEYEGQVKEFMSVFERKDTDGIVVAGGNGTLLEAVTGLMRKEDKIFRQSVPIGVIPVGYRSKFARFLYGEEKSDVRRMLDSAMAVVRGTTKKLDVLKIKGDEEKKATYALMGLEAGEVRDAEERKSKYWFFGPLKSRFTYLRSTFKSWPPLIHGHMEYILATEENEHWKKVDAPLKPEAQKRSGSWFSFLYKSNRKMPVKQEAEVEEEDIDLNEEGVDKVSRDVSTIEMTLTSTVMLPEQKLTGIEMGLGPENPTKTEFIIEGWTRIKEPSLKPGSPRNEQILVKKVKFVPEIPEGSEEWYAIDGEKFEALPIEVSLLKKRVNFYVIAEDLSR